MTSSIIDTHAHLDEGRFAGDLEGVLQRAQEARVTRVVISLHPAVRLLWLVIYPGCMQRWGCTLTTQLMWCRAPGMDCVSWLRAVG